MRVLELDISTGSLKTWMRVKYTIDRVNKLVLIESRAVVNPPREEDKSRRYIVS
jgi:hypothetical protein